MNRFEVEIDPDVHSNQCHITLVANIAPIFGRLIKSAKVPDSEAEATAQDFRVNAENYYQVYLSRPSGRR